MESILENIKKTCGKNTNCYETIDTIKQLFNKETEKDIKNLENLML